MITEDYVSFEVANLLKEKGFNEDCRDSYDWKGNFHLNTSSNNGSIKKIAAPTLQMAIKWLREVHNICITIYPDKEKGYEAVLYDVRYDVEIILQSFGIFGAHIFEDSYEQACESAIKYCLENLIKITK